MKPIVAALIAAALLAALKASAQEGSTQQAAVPPIANEPYVPGLGEIMALQQMRHIKLWFAGRAGNWPLADYEIDELKEGFDGVNKQLGGDTVDKAVGAQISALEKVVEAKDRAAFTGAFDKLSAGCNSCHQLLDRGFIVIRRPSLLPYSDQSFAAQR
jgi:hypothetical protein